MIALAAITLALTPWHGPSLPTASPAAAKYKLTVHGPARQRVDLHAGGLPSGWVASFCTPTYCSPFEYRVQLDDHGVAVIEFQAIRTDEAAPKHATVTITAPDAKPTELHV